MHIAFAIIVFITGVVIMILSVGGLIGTFPALLHYETDSSFVLVGFVSSWFGLVGSIGILWLSRKLAIYANPSSQSSPSSAASSASSSPPKPSNTLSILVEHPSGHLEIGTTSLETIAKDISKKKDPSNKIPV